MKRAMVFVLVILAFAVVTRADGITIGNGDFAARSGDFFGSQAFAAELQGAYRADEGGLAVLDEGRSLRSVDDAERLNADVFFFSFLAWSKLGDDSAEFDFIHRRIDGLAGTHDKWRSRLSGFEHPEPFHAEPGVETVPEPGTLLLIGAGCMALAVRKRCRAFDAD
jgi:PEP-CTERM motif